MLKSFVSVFPESVPKQVSYRQRSESRDCDNLFMDMNEEHRSDTFARANTKRLFALVGVLGFG